MVEKEAYRAIPIYKKNKQISISSTSNRKDCNMLEIVGKFLDSLYETSKSCDDFSIYKFQKEWYENNGYVVLFDNGHHTVFHKAKDN